MAEVPITKLKTRLPFIALGLALAVPVAWLAALRGADRPERVASRETPTVAAVDAKDIGRTAGTQTSSPVSAKATATNDAPSAAVPPPIASPPVTAAASSSTGASDAGMPVRQAIDSGRAQPLFIALRAPKSVRVGEPFKVEVTGESENDFARVALAVQFDPRRLRVASVRQGDLLAQAHATAPFSYGVDAQAGRVSVEVSENEGAHPVSGGGTLCIVEFVPIAPGRALLSMADVAVGDLNNEAVAYSALAPTAVAVRE